VIDSQLLEIAGRHRLIEQLLEAGIEVSLPIRDRGIDLIAYIDVDHDSKQFLSVPIQMKAASQAIFSINQRYSRFPDLLLAYVWYASDPAKTVVYVMTQAEAMQIGDELGFTQTHSWKKGTYVVTKPSARLISRLDPFKSNSVLWRKRLSSAARSR
jgi:hypothetical protein